jgi:alpha-ketoglutarate-dependent taurine dioxygenase
MTITPDAPEITLEVTPLSGSIGAEIRGVDLTEALDARTLARIRSTLLERKVVFFPGQYLDPDSHLRFARAFGEPTPAHPVLKGIDGYPEIFEIDYTDVTFVERPPLGSILNAVVIPPSGGDTLFSDQQAAFAGLSPALQDFLSTLTAVHDGNAQFARALHAREDGGHWEGQPVDLKPVEHPVVRTHPEMGERTLFVNPGFTSHIKELARDESDHLLAFLYAHSVKPEYTVRYHWHAGDLGFWDNRSTQHAVVGDFGDQHRVIQRVTLRGDVPV